MMRIAVMKRNVERWCFVECFDEEECCYEEECCDEKDGVFMRSIIMRGGRTL